jgi:WD40 repeat protein
VTAVVITPDGRHAVSASDDKTVRVWELKTGQLAHILQGHSAGVTAVAITRDSRRVVSASRDKTLRVWELETSQSVSTFQGHSGWVTAVAITTDGRRAVSTSDDKTLRFWNLESGNEIATFTGEGAMHNCAVAPDGWTIVAGDASGQVHFLRLIEADKLRLAAGETKIQLLRREKPATHS